MASRERQTFNDGVVTICSVKNTAQKGDLPQEVLEKRYRLHYEEKTVGINRYWSAYQNDVKIERLIRCHKLPDVTTSDIAVLENGTQYRIKQIQYPEDAPIPVMALSLERIGNQYGFI